MGTLVPISPDEDATAVRNISRLVYDQRAATASLRAVIKDLGGASSGSESFDDAIRAALALAQGAAAQRFTQTFQRIIKWAPAIGVILDFNVDGDARTIVDHLVTEFGSRRVSASRGDISALIEDIRARLRQAAVPSSRTEAGVLGRVHPRDIQWGLTFGKFNAGHLTQSKAVLYAFIAESSDLGIG